MSEEAEEVPDLPGLPRQLKFGDPPLRTSTIIQCGSANEREEAYATIDTSR